ncbi:TetR/AcrR family transcriptional regulator [Actinocrispum wychmicini]|uniref:TetR family transcriptional regulator n=1 Tax=Actinocrispum wychmicini TaxID=1213861 RepID=A0A4R2JE40_9PSEU|nr:TetR/AcrR family transcriptional regulator [Actinocrispum wychmicini]TCO57244.1 TetR family transcriptional regulator [Actinocrispum wychmicini]
MSPRGYHSDKRQAAAEETRRRILETTRRIMAGKGIPQLTIDVVAAQADVSRQTVYNAFGSKSGLLEALCDYLGERGKIERIGQAFTAPDGTTAIARLVTAFYEFWATDRTVTRRLRGLATVDKDLDAVIKARTARQRLAVGGLLNRFPDLDASGREREHTVDLLCAVASFEMFDMLAGQTELAVAAAMALLSEQALVRGTGE